ncbi:MAG: primase-helicase zinc-binding domain-containing protein [Thermodesulfobacteriota bacterium]
MLNNLEELLRSDGFTLRRETARELSGSCPWCGGRDRFRVFLDGDREQFWCRQCNRSGDAITYLRDRRGLTFQEAARLAGLEPGNPALMPRPQTAPVWTPRPATIPPAAWKVQAARVLEAAERRLWSRPGREVLDWLRQERGLKDHTIKTARLGFMPLALYLDRENWGLPAETKEDGRPRKLWIPRGLLIPFLAGDEIHRLRIRRMVVDDGPRYVLVSGSSTRPMTLGTGPMFSIVESELDGFLLWQEAGDLTGVVALGSASIRPDAETAERLKAASIILVALDADQAGIKEAWDWWPRHFPNSRRLPLPKGFGKDPSEAWKRGLNLRDWIKAGLTLHGLPVDNLPVLGKPAIGQPANGITR